MLFRFVHSRSLWWVVLLFGFLFCFPRSVAASEQLTVNEVAWMGTEVSGYDEWIELVNNSDETIDLSGWQIVAEDGAPQIDLAGEITPDNFYLLERSNDETVPEVTADLIYTGSLENGGEKLFLKDATGEIVDEVSGSDGWPAGDNDSKATMQYCDGSWISQTSTPKQPNRCFSSRPTPTPTLILSPTPSLTLFPTPSSIPTPSPSPTSTNLPVPVLIYLNEVLPNPNEGAESIELYNPNNYSVDLSNWQLDDSASSGSAGQGFSAQIAAKNFHVVNLNNAIFNNSGDIVRLLDGEGRSIDETSYEAIDKGVSWGKNGAGWCEMAPSLGFENNSCQADDTATSQEEDQSNDQYVNRPPRYNQRACFFSKEEIVLSPVLGKKKQSLAKLAVYPTSINKAEKQVSWVQKEDQLWHDNFWFYSGGAFISFALGKLLLVG